MVLNTQLLGNNLYCVIQKPENFRRRLEKVSMLFLGNNQQMHGVDRPMIRDYNHLISFIEYLCRQFSADYASEY